jgi:hypothetical protein
MTPEQERNYWILEGYPLMPEWIEFCRGYEGLDMRKMASGHTLGELVSTWLEHTGEKISDCGGRFDIVNDNSGKFFLSYTTANGTRYNWNTGEDHAIK